MCTHTRNQPSSLPFLLCTLQSQVCTCTMWPGITSLPLLLWHGSLGFWAWERGTSANETTTNTGVHAPWIAMDPNFVAGILEREPFKPPIGVRPKPTMHTSAPVALAIKRNFKICYKPPQLCQFLWFQSSINSLGLLQPEKSWDILLVIIFILTKEILQLGIKRYHLPRLIRSYVFIETNRTSCHVPTWPQKASHLIHRNNRVWNYELHKRTEFQWKMMIELTHHVVLWCFRPQHQKPWPVPSIIEVWGF